MKMSKKLRFWFVYHLGILIFSFLVAMFIKYQQKGDAIVPETVLVTLMIFFMSIFIGYLAIGLINKASKLSHEDLTKKVLPAFIFFLISVAIIANVVVSLGVFVWYLIEGIPLSQYFSNLFKYELAFANRNLFFWLWSFSFVFFYILWRKSAKKEQILREEKLKYQYQTLKSQINPHFLFNSFNALSELVYEDAKKADNYIQELSKIYRYVIDNEDNRLISLKEELEFVNHYFNLHKVRNNEKTQLNIDIEHAENYKVVPVSVQSLVENAIKHNSASLANPLFINIFMEDGNVVVKNNFQKKTTFEATTQKGLSNLREQVRLILNKEVSVLENNKEFIVKVPIQV